MRRLPLALALAIACQSLSAPDVQAAAHPAAAKTAQRTTWLVWFEEAPLASFRGAEQAKGGRLAGLKATSPEATGARRLDVNAPASRAYRAALEDLRAERLREGARRIGRALEPLFAYEVTSHGVALELTAEEARALESVPGVAQVEPDFVRRPMTDAGPQWIHADTVWNAALAAGGNRGEGIVVGVIDSGINSKHVMFNDNGTTGGGFTIANPRGVKYGKCNDAAPPATLRCNNKLIGVYDFTTGTDSGETDDGSDGTGHGTHVASTAAGIPWPVGNITFGNGIRVSGTLSGVAPRANLISYKACEDAATCKGSWVLAALDQAVADRVDVINYSLGGGAYDPWAYSQSDAMAMLAAREAGTVVVASAGNDGPGPGTVGSPSAAPWVISVAAASHDRAQVATLTLSGGNTAPPGGGVLEGASATTAVTGTRPIVYAGNYGSALCAEGSDVDALPPSTSTKPAGWNAGTFSSQIVVCDRGTYARVIKGLNVKNAGGSGMVLVNQAAEGESVVADAHELPATHLGYEDGAALKAWLASGSGHNASIGVSRVSRLASFGDVLASFSGRGPVDGDWLKPNLAAPGVYIAAAGSSGTNTATLMSGTSMATPHVTGAVALLLNAHPAWGPADVESALQTTARASVRLPDGVTPAGVFDQGAGTVDVAKAMRAALRFSVSINQFCRAGLGAGNTYPSGHFCRNQTGNPIQPRDLNLPALVDSNCIDASFRTRCTFGRVVRDIGGGATWRVDTSGVPGLTANVSQFTLAADASQGINFTFAPAPGQYPYSGWAQGYVLLKDAAGAKPDVSIPVAIRVSPGNVPDVVTIGGGPIGTPPPGTGIQDGGWSTLPLDDLVALPDLRLVGSDLVRPLIASPSVAQDPSTDDPYDGLVENTSLFWLVAPEAGEYRLRADATWATSRDVDLWVGTPGVSNSPNEDDELCYSATLDPSEHCDLIVNAAAGQRFWVVLQNYTASAAGSDVVNLEAALVPVAPGGGALRAAGPGHTGAGEAFGVRLAWDDPTFAPGETRWGHLLIGSGEGGARVADVGRVLVKIIRSNSTLVPNIARAIAPGDENMLTFRLGPNQTHDRLYFDVPPNASRIDVLLRGSTGNADLYLSRIDTPAGPVVAAAPPIAQAVAKSEKAGSNEDLSVSGAALTPGRWYVTPVNKTANPVDLTLRLRVSYGSNRPATSMGAWGDPAVLAHGGQGSGLFLYRAGELWAATWYTFLEDGSPVWYQGVTGLPESRDSHWDFTLNRFTWNGSEQVEAAVGRGQLVLTGAQEAVFNWTLFGQSGSTRLVNIDVGTCSGISGTRVDGMWYAPTPPGYSAIGFAGLESYTAYSYDALGTPRWFIATYDGPLAVNQTRNVTVQQLNDGPCPTCDWQAPTVHEVGVLQRRYGSAGSGQFSLDLSYQAPVPGDWTVNEQVTRITDAVPCSQ